MCLFICPLRIYIICVCIINIHTDIITHRQTDMPLCAGVHAPKSFLYVQQKCISERSKHDIDLQSYNLREHVITFNRDICFTGSCWLVLLGCMPDRSSWIGSRSLGIRTAEPR